MTDAERAYLTLLDPDTAQEVERRIKADHLLDRAAERAEHGDAREASVLRDRAQAVLETGVDPGWS
jgi:hypothetical protein